MLPRSMVYGIQLFTIVLDCVGLIQCESSAVGAAPPILSCQVLFAI
jgi:hypothetical protein